jgi:hypothetical protein
MRLKKKFLIIGVSCVVVLAGVLGGFAVASADDSGSVKTTSGDSKMMPFGGHHGFGMMDNE